MEQSGRVPHNAGSLRCSTFASNITLSKSTHSDDMSSLDFYLNSLFAFIADRLFFVVKEDFFVV